MAEGRFDIAANSLQAFLDSNPSDADFLEIEKKHGTTAFTMLRTIPKWSDDVATEKKTRANVEEAIKRARRERKCSDPARGRSSLTSGGRTRDARGTGLKRMGDFGPLMVNLRITRHQRLCRSVGALSNRKATRSRWIARSTD